MKTPLDRRKLGRLLTHLANTGTLADSELTPPEHAGDSAWRIGLTGAPGAGKSTLAGQLAVHRARDLERVGVLAIDPSSPKTQGAILGDRIRMDDVSGSERLFIRSFGSRSSTDGLADNIAQMLELMDAFEFDEVLLETVGVGQAEHASRALVDTLVLVLPPDGGDAVQAMKAGVMELADLYVINKADQASARRMEADVRSVLALTHSRPAPNAWRPTVLLTSQKEPSSVTKLSQAIDEHIAWAKNASADRMTARARYRLRRHLERQLDRVVSRLPEVFFKQSFELQVAQALRALAHT